MSDWEIVAIQHFGDDDDLDDDDVVDDEDVVDDGDVGDDGIHQSRTLGQA